MYEKINKGWVKAVSISEHKGERKVNQPQIEVKENWGVANDAHAGESHRQISLLAVEAIDGMRLDGFDVVPGDFAENITTRDFDLSGLNVGERLRIGQGVILKISQLGKECHGGCDIFKQVGHCVMPQQGVFAVVEQGGMIYPEDNIVKLG